MEYRCSLVLVQGIAVRLHIFCEIELRARARCSHAVKRPDSWRFNGVRVLSRSGP